MKIAKIAIVKVLGSAKHEHTFNTLAFMKNKLKNRLITHMFIVVGMHSQSLFTLETFPYDVTYDDWKTT
jgi:hypothetical protein